MDTVTPPVPAAASIVAVIPPPPPVSAVPIVPIGLPVPPSVDQVDLLLLSFVSFFLLSFDSD
jgi:D-ribose pyranose/furanose isomerase RbsD